MTRIFFLCAVFLSLACSVSAQLWPWANAPLNNSNQFSVGNGLVTDPAGNVYVTGSFGSDSITFGSVLLTNSTPGYLDMYLVKYDVSGNVLWAKSAGGTQDDAGVGVALDGAGNVFVCGSFNSASITFGSTVLTNAAANLNDIFMVKYTPSGTVIWAKRAGGTGDDTPKGISTDLSGHFFIGGNYSSPSLTFGTSTLTNAGSLDVFIARYDTSGVVSWAKGAGGTGSDLLQGICTDHYGNACITGSFYSPSITFGTFALNNTAGHNIFISKYDTGGVVTWAKRPSGVGGQGGNAVCSDGYGKIYLAGEFSGSYISFGSIILNNGNTGENDICLVKYDSLGQEIWGVQSTGLSNGSPSSLCTDFTGNVYMGGTFSSNTIVFGSCTLNNVGSVNLFVAKFDKGGNSYGGTATGGLASDYVNGASCDASGNTYLTGYFSSSSIAFGTHTLLNAGAESMFAAKLTGLTGIQSFSPVELNVTVFPQPFSTATVFHWRKAPVSALTLTIYSCQGQILRKIPEIHGESLELQRENLPAGMCFYVFENDMHQVVSRGKLIVF
jgi:hypothetical protein